MIWAWLGSVLAAFGFGVWITHSYDTGQVAKTEVKVMQEKVVATNQVVTADTKQAQASAPKVAEIKATRKKTKAKVIEHAKTIPDPVQCFLEPERVSNINAALGFPPEDKPGVPEGVSGPPEAPVGVAPAGRGLGSDLGFRLPRVQAAPSGPGGSGEGAGSGDQVGPPVD